MTNHLTLQDKLQKNIIEFTTNGSDRYTIDDLDKHIINMEILRGEFKHTIYIEEKITNKDNRNCFAYMLGVEQPILPCFVKYLIDKNILICNKERGDMVIYFDQYNRPIHGGKKENNLVLSKWNAGHVWKHGLLEVPTSYNSNVNFFSMIIGPQTVKEKFYEYCQKQEIYIPEKTVLNKAFMI